LIWRSFGARMLQLDIDFTRSRDTAIRFWVKPRKWCLVRSVLSAVLVAVATGCSREQAPAEPPAETAAAPATEQETSSTSAPTASDAWKPDDERESLPSNRIYYTLTDYPWYARGEPLMHTGRPHVASGLPITASVEEMEKAGEYEGVEFYTRREESEPVLYVPVFEGYWLGFRLNTTSGVARSLAQ